MSASKLAVAAHEAAHAVAYVKLGLPGEVTFIQIDDANDPAGHTEYSIPEDAMFSKDDARNKMVQCLVGAYAQTKIDDDCEEAKLDAEDDDQLFDGCAKIFGVEGTYGGFRDKAREFVKQHWDDILKLAQALLATPSSKGKHRLDQAVVYELLQP